jgi:mannose-6-phosphate isomerase-like protein (cupin superfamily)
LTATLATTVSLPPDKGTTMPPAAINLRSKLASFTEQWSPKIIAQIDDYQFKLVRLQGDFVWHSHSETDEVFLVLHGRLRIDFRDGEVTLSEGELLVVPRGVEHKPYAESECHVLILVRDGTVNTGNAPPSERTAPTGDWI